MIRDARRRGNHVLALRAAFFDPPVVGYNRRHSGRGIGIAEYPDAQP